MTWRGNISVLQIRSVEWTYHVGNVAVSSEIVGTALAVGVRDIQELNERVSDITDIIHNWGSHCRANNPKVMGKREDRPIAVLCAELRVHSVI